MILWVGHHLLLVLFLVVLQAALATFSVYRLGAIAGDIEDYLLDHSSASIYGWIIVLCLLSIGTVVSAVIFLIAIWPTG